VVPPPTEVIVIRPSSFVFRHFRENTMNTREQILTDIRTALQRDSQSPIQPLSASARVASRVPGDAAAEMQMLFNEITKLGGVARHVPASELTRALEQLVQEQQIRRATCWNTPELAALDVPARLMQLGVQLVAPHADSRALAECDLGVTGVDLALPETGTLVLRSSADKPRAVSLLPRVHLALLSPAALCADLDAVFEQVKGEGYWVFITGPSRTADIELTVTIGVHGPKALYVWNIER